MQANPSADPALLDAAASAFPSVPQRDWQRAGLLSRRPVAIVLATLVLATLVLATVAGSAILPWIGGRDARAAMAQLADVAAEERAYDDVLGLLKDAETGQRGYLITANRAFLAPYDTALAALPAAFVALQAAADSPQERAAVNALQQLSDQRLALLAYGIQTRDLGGFAPAAQAVADDGGAQLMGRLRALIGARLAMLAEQRRALRDSIDAPRASARVPGPAGTDHNR